MTTCSEGHAEICYEGKECPFCEAIESYETQIGSLEQEIDDLQEQQEQQDQLGKDE